MNKKLLSIGIITLVCLAAIGWWTFLRPKPTPAAPIQTQEDSTSSIATGNPKAKVHIVTYIDLLCDDCQRAHREILPRIKQDFVDTNKVKLTYKMLGTFGPESMSASNAAYCANEQGKFFDFIDAGYAAKTRTSNESAFSRIGLTSIARESKLSIPEWSACLDRSPYTEHIKDNKQEVLATKGYGTPHFIINGKGYNGAPPYDIFVPIINAAIAEQGGN